MQISPYKPDVDLFQTPYFFFSNSRDSEILYVSPSVQDVLGYSPCEMVGRNYTEFFDSEVTSNQVRLPSQRRPAKQTSRTSLRAVAARDGSTKVLKIQSYGKVDESGRIVVDHTIAQDISGEFEARTHINERLEKLLSVEAALSEREANTLKSVIAGIPNKAIAKQFSITERAVEMIRSRLMKKFEVGTSAELIALASELETLRGVLQFNE